MRITGLGLAAVLVWGTVCQGQVTEKTPGWFVYDIPALAAPQGGVVDLSHLNPGPIEGPGYVSVANGHFLDGEGQRLRMFGTNVTGDSCFPDEEISPRLALRLRQYGFNCLRLHFMDFSSGTTTRDSLWEDPETGKLSAKNLAKLDRLIAECGKNGIYLDLNLHVGRAYPGLPQVPGSRAFRYSKNLDRWYEPYILQMEQFCKDLLNHVNPHTKRRYADEPAIACIEINNENTMIRDSDLSDLRRLPAPFIDALEQKWTAWLCQRYGSTAALKRAWNAEVIPLGQELLTNDEAWRVQNAGGAASTLDKKGERLTWTATSAGNESWNLQLQYKQLTLKPGRYTLAFRARSKDSKRLGISLMLDAVPYGTVGLNDTVALTPQWQTYTLSGPVKEANGPGPLRLNISLRNQAGQVELENVSLRPGGGIGLPEGQSCEAGVKLPGPTVVSAVTADWTRFLIETEMETTRRIVHLLKNDIACKMPIADTQVSYGGVAGVLREDTLCDYVDIHGYWEHPQYTRSEKGWVTGFRIPNTSQVASVSGGTLSRMGVYRIADRPFSISEYNTPAPNDHGAELFPLFSAVASLQDWDAFYSYTYRDFGKEYESTFIRKYFHMIGRANVLVHAPASALAFRAGLIDASTAGANCTIPIKQVPELTMETGSVGDVWQQLDGDPAAVWLRKATVKLSPTGTQPTLEGDASVPNGVRVSDTKEIRWNPTDPQGAWFSLNAPSVRFLIGHVGGRSFDVGDVHVDVHRRPWPRKLPAYACISLAALDKQPLATSRRILLAASARTENAEMPWNDDRTGFDVDKWGNSPTLSEAVPLDLQVPGGSVRAWQVTPEGRQGKEIALDGNVLRLRPEHRTLWVLLTRP